MLVAGYPSILMTASPPGPSRGRHLLDEHHRRRSCVEPSSVTPQPAKRLQ
jgi:hypothetical protein